MGKRGNETVGTFTEPLSSKMFRQLRPVAFSLKTDLESKRTSFGFLAQELQALYPSVVHAGTSVEGSVPNPLSVSYQDLIAVITLTVQQEMSRLDLVQNLLVQVETTAERHETVLQSSEAKIQILEQELKGLQMNYKHRLDTMKAAQP